MLPDFLHRILQVLRIDAMTRPHGLFVTQSLH